jgi:hypothetical protein
MVSERQYVKFLTIMEQKVKYFISQVITNVHQSSSVITCSKSAPWMLPTQTNYFMSHSRQNPELKETTSGGICHKQLFKTNRTVMKK